ncbi:DUF4275 family protein [Planomicrobium sp. CPCC 101079]|uniref:DUF4275 family protein n=1 Tax=Planomicrobium sp. CPCC 101079 TaxID=2599618 RepID=UPI0011B63A04|nr:DUF4275 family protein [Planomicrobium sp. CPCC 101079]TWT09227.1 DUF4275 family protein [Planomicrobium sp. CPCC 101079]
MDEFIHMQTKRLHAMNISFEVVPNKDNELEQRWEDAFAKGISKSQKRKMAFNQCMWNVFSWGKIECLKEQRAKEAFDLQKKAGCFLVCTSSYDAIRILKANRLKAKDITHIGSDLYIVDEHFDWTYVLTHEEDCGPYFYKPRDSF